MEKDFSVKGREAFLANTFFDPPKKDKDWEFIFARWTLLQRVIWEFMPDDTYCHLDGYDLDEFHRFTHGFVGAGRVWHLPEAGTPGDIPTILAVEFDPTGFQLKHASVWVGRTILNIKDKSKVEIPNLKEILERKHDIGADWQHAFWKEGDRWSLDCDFDLSVFLMPKADEGNP